MSVNAKMTSIADAIRRKTGGTVPLTLDDMATAIDSIQTGAGQGPEPLYLLQGGAAAGPVDDWSTAKDGFHYGDNTYGRANLDTASGTLTITTDGNSGHRHGFNVHTTNAIDIVEYIALGYKNLALQGSARAIVGFGLAPAFAPLTTSVSISSSETNIWNPVAKAYPSGYAIVVFAWLNGKVSIPLRDLEAKCNAAGINTADCKIVLFQTAQYQTSATGTYSSIYFE